MTRLLLALAVALVAAGSSPAAAQPAGDDAPLVPVKFDPSMCVKTPAPDAGPANLAPPATWSSFSVEGTLLDKPDVVRALFEPTMNRQRALTDDARDDVRRIARSFGYQLVGLGTKDTPVGTQAVIHLAPLPIVRTIDVDVRQKIVDLLTTPLLDDEIKRRMHLRIGSYLAWAPIERNCQLLEEQRGIEEYLRDEGYFEARVAITENHDGPRFNLSVKVRLGPDYVTGVINIAKHDPFPISDEDITKLFRHKRCIVGDSLCFGLAKFKRARHSDDIQKVVDAFHVKGYPAVRVRTDFDPLTSFDRKTKTVGFTVTIDQRRKLLVNLEGFDPDELASSELHDQLTFDKAASSDDVEAAESAKALTNFLQNKGYFDAHVTWIRERFDRGDTLTFRIEAGHKRQVRLVDIVGNVALKKDVLDSVIGTRAVKLSSSLFGDSTHASSDQLAADVDSLVHTYHRAGYREARVSVSAATDPAALGSAALTAGLQAADRGDDLYVRFNIEEGQPTMLVQVQIMLSDQGDAVVTPDQRTLCALALSDVAELYGDPQLATPVGSGRCVAVATNLTYREADVADVRDRLKDRLYSHGRPRAKVTLETRSLGPHRFAAAYTLTDVVPLTIGKVVIRGNFRTTDQTIRKLLQFDEGKPLTKDMLAEGARRLRNTGLFESVNIAMPDLENTSQGSVNAVIEIAERYDYRAQIDFEFGYSEINGLFITANPAFKNLFGIGLSLDLRGTVGLDLSEYLSSGEAKLKQLAAEATLRAPQWLSQRIFPFLPDKYAFQTELNMFHRRQDTDRFGLITTDGVTLSLLRTWQRPRIGSQAARAITFGPHYDFRNRERPVDVLRPLGADDDQTQVPISTRTGSVGAAFEWEQRTDRSGTLSPLAPEAGFRFEAQASYATPYLGGQDTFIKLSTAGTKYLPIGSNFVLRGDLRYDQGIPLGGAVLLPEVERFFAGGDSTVRGYEDDRLATEIIQVGVPPLGNANQIRILPSGGNIRLMSSVDAQVRIWKVFATGVFADAGMITNQWSTVTADDIRPSVGIALVRIVTPFGSLAFERAIPLRPQLGDNPRGRFHLSFAARAQF